MNRAANCLKGIRVLNSVQNDGQIEMAEACSARCIYGNPDFGYAIRGARREMRARLGWEFVWNARPVGVDIGKWVKK